MGKIIYICPKCKIEMVNFGEKDKGPLPCKLFLCTSCKEYYHLIETGHMLTLKEYMVLRVAVEDDVNGGAS